MLTTTTKSPEANLPTSPNSQIHLVKTADSPTSLSEQSMCSTILPFLLASVLTLMAKAQRRAPRYAALSSGHCDDVGMRVIYTLRECEQAARELHFRWDWQVDSESSYTDQPDGCSVRDERMHTGRYALFAQRKNSCRIGARAPDWIPDLRGRADCLCTRFSPCVCAVDSVVANCPSGKFGHTPVYDYDGNVVESRKYCIP